VINRNHNQYKTDWFFNPTFLPNILFYLFGRAGISSVVKSYPRETSLVLSLKRQSSCTINTFHFAISVTRRLPCELARRCLSKYNHTWDFGAFVRYDLFSSRIVLALTSSADTYVSEETAAGVRPSVVHKFRHIHTAARGLFGFLRIVLDTRAANANGKRREKRFVTLGFCRRVKWRRTRFVRINA